MDRKYVLSGALLVAGLSLIGCDREGYVEDELEDLREAQRNSPNVASDLQNELANAKAEVERLQEELALAKQGITQEVVEERKELKQALSNQAQDVKEEVKEAQHAARSHTKEAEVAHQQLERAQPTQHVEAQVHTETQVTPAGNDVELKREKTSIPVETSHVVERTSETPIDQEEIEQRRAMEERRSAEAER